MFSTRISFGLLADGASDGERPAFAAGEPIRASWCAVEQVDALEVADHVKSGELRRRPKWSSSRFGIRYEAK